MTPELHTWLFRTAIIAAGILTVWMARNQYIIRCNDRAIKRLKHRTMEAEAERALWAKRRKEAAEDAKSGGYTLCDRCKLRRVENYPGSTMCTWCGI